MNLYTNISYKDKTGIIIYNTNPTTWNCLYSFYELNHKFTIDEYNFGKEDITYRELIEEYQKVYNGEAWCEGSYSLYSRSKTGL